MKKYNPEILKLLRIIHQNYAQKYVASFLNLSQQAYSKMEAGNIQPSSEVLQKLMELYNLPCIDIFYLDTEDVKKRLLNTSFKVKEFDFKDLSLSELKYLKQKLKKTISYLKYRLNTIF